MNPIIVTIKDWIASVLGVYTPVTYQETLLVADVANGGSITRTYEKVAEGMAGLDYEYIFTALFLLIAVYSVFRLLGILMQALCGVRR